LDIKIKGVRVIAIGEVGFDYGVPKKRVFGTHRIKHFGGRSGFVERSVERDEL
jgi:Tat protein secretion system quality control protein TatD with DNase activity